MTEIPLPALDGTNPLGFLAALGVLDIVSTAMPKTTLKWTDDLVPTAVIGGDGDLDTMLDALDRDREKWTANRMLAFPENKPLTDAKPPEAELREWFEFVQDDDAAADHLAAIVAEWAFDGARKAKPTHLHFTAGRQQFLGVVRELAAGVDRDRLRETLSGPWRYDSPMKSLSWDSRGERIYAIRATNPSGEQRLGVPGADWLAFRGLVFYPVTRGTDGRLLTTGCDAAWKKGSFRWPLWSVPVTRDVVRSLVADRTLIAERRRSEPDPKDLAARGILCVRESKIRRNDQGGYGSFSGSEDLVRAT